MTNEKIYQMSVSQIYPLLVSKAEKKGRTKAEVDEIVRWLTGYSQAQLEALQGTPTTYAEFFQNAPHLNEGREQIAGKVCGVRVEEIEDPLMREIRRLDKLIDELAKGRPMDKILRR